MITELKPTNLIAVEVALDANNYSNYYKGLLSFSTDKHSCKIDIPTGEFKILDEVTKDKIGFDVTPYSDKYNTGFYREHKDKSFYYLLAANGLYFENHLPKPEDVLEKIELSPFPSPIGYQMQKEWQSFEDKLIKGKLLILEKL